MGGKLSAALDKPMIQRLSAWIGFFGFIIGKQLAPTTHHVHLNAVLQVSHLSSFYECGLERLSKTSTIASKFWDNKVRNLLPTQATRLPVSNSD